MMDKKYLLWFSSLKMIPRKKFMIYEIFKDFEKIYKMDASELLKYEYFNMFDVFEFSKHKDEKYLNKCVDFINKNDISVISISDSLYPDNLKNIYDPPIVLYTKGNLELLKKPAIGIVGSRSADNYGLKTAYTFSKALSKCGFTIVSGLAKGIDYASHIGAINELGSTIGIIGTGIDVCYPRENYNIYNSMLDKGLIISEYIIGTQPSSTNFPMRNRIISGICEKIIVVEAGEKSGSLITANYALEQGKEVLAVPGNIDNPLCIGTNRLIFDGARPVTNIIDLLDK